MRNPFAGLGLWWALAAVTVVGLVFAAFGRVLIGGGLVAIGLAVCLLLRVFGESRGFDLGAVQLRSQSMDVWLYSTAVINMAGASMLVTRNMSVRWLVIADFALVMWGLVMLVLSRKNARAAVSASQSELGDVSD
ncbi:Uncharacterised protein [Dermatophilus congolensis]|uniref:Uncharacterized protein n=1 Tax=Dermatophilus congolensis TaxID=1863 RepID=A0AA46BL80_9MICO|nr:hypothetical protein [Dermatophilus congolensis]STD03456.1 Uncharacterised protein [Dermatophilus congolensis]